jgi:solute carrier family 25 (mitochondrial phosphate transporter), member 3
MGVQAQEKHDLSYYAKCMLGGIFACGLTHTLTTPLDLVKCRKQVDPKIYKSLGHGLSTIKAEGGVRGLFLGWQPTLIGYSMQGFGKFGFYEMFKDVYKKLFGAKADKYKTTGFLVSSACAEVIADCLLCPMESLKVRMQTSKAGTFPSTFGAGYAELAKEGTQGFYKGLVPLMARQVPYTMVKFGAFENTVIFCYKYIWTKPKSEYSKATQLMVTFLSGYWAGIFCAIVSHPADTMVSKLNNVKSDGKQGIGSAVSKIYADIGFSGLWSGLSTRIIMIGTLTGLQWWIYDGFKSAVGLQTTGGK